MNADSQVKSGSDLTGMNLISYCGNNPVNRLEPTGHSWLHWVIAAVVVVVCAVAVVATAGGVAPALMALACVGSGADAATTDGSVNCFSVGSKFIDPWRWMGNCIRNRCGYSYWWGY